MTTRTGTALIVTGGLALAIGLVTLAAPSAHAAGGQDGVCPNGVGDWSAKIDTTDNPTSVTVPNESLPLPSGKLIAEYCVKGGNPTSGGGKFFVTVDPPANSVTITMPDSSSIKTISHYSVRFVDDGDDTTTTVPETTVPDTTVPETTVPDTTVPETTVPDTTVPETTVPDTTVPETTVPETTTTEVASGGPTTTVVASGGPTTTVVASGGPTTTVVASGGPVTSPRPRGALPSTGSDLAPYLLALGTVFLLTGGAMTAVRRHTI